MRISDLSSDVCSSDLLRYDQVAIPHEERRMLLARVLFIKMRHEPYLADPVLGAYRRGGVEIVVDHEPLPAAVLAFDGAPDAHMAEPGIALFRVRLPGPEIGRAHVCTPVPNSHP